METLQKQRQQREVRRAAERSKDNHERLIQRGAESKTSYGRVLLQEYAEAVSLAIDVTLGELLIHEEKAGPFMKFWPLLLYFANRGPRSIALIALGQVLDRINSKPERMKLALAIGKALQDERTAHKLQQRHGTALLSELTKKFGRRSVQAKTLEKLRVQPSDWETEDKRGVGNLLLELIAANTDLIEFSADKKQRVLPTAVVADLIRANPPRPLSVRSLPSLLPPVPWDGPMRGKKPLVGSRAAIDRSHLTPANLEAALVVVNKLEQQELVIDPWMAQVQREAWDSNMPDLFPVRRDPGTDFSPSEDVWIRTRIEEALRQAEEVAGMPIWLEHDMDFRGRLYCSSRMAGHQGPDHQKALISFAGGERMNDDAFEQLMAAAAGHYGLGHSSWGERVQWCRAHLDQIEAIAAAPLDRADLWKGADDPWQYLQACKAIADFMADDSKPCGCPVRFDQTASGMGIAAMLTRDQELARHTNVIGSTRHDLYGYVAERLVQLLTMDLDSWDPFEVRMAEFWLKLPINRSLTKGPTMTTIYGSRQFGIREQVTAWLQQVNPDVPVGRWKWEYTVPAQYLARKIGLLIGAELKSCVALDAWLRDVSSKCVKKGKRLRWDAPSGFPLNFGSSLEDKQKTNSLLYGSRRWKHVDVDVEPGELSVRATNRGITANTIHAFDAAMVHLLVVRCGWVQAPLLTNHDCFATTPARAQWLHQALSAEMREMYKTDWLAEIRVEISEHAGFPLPHPPQVGTLAVGKIGENPYCFC